MNKLNRNRYKDFECALSNEIRAEIARQNKTVSSLADEIKYRRATLSAKLNGHTSFSGEEIGKIANCLNVTASELMRRAEEAVAPACPTASSLRHPQTPESSLEATPSDPAPLADEREAGMWQAVLDHKARCADCDTLLQAQTHLTQLALTEGEERYIRHLRRLARADAASTNVEVA